MDNQRKKKKKRSPTIIKKIPKEIKNRISQNSIYIYISISISLSLSQRDKLFLHSLQMSISICTSSKMFLAVQ